ncbi:MAG: transcriptional repressor [Synergistaceae bacterium]|jgi:Fur family peroxide stress response transcriptional regulator|nr:transcriptional repressor [Synergistaceae bacterium]
MFSVEEGIKHLQSSGAKVTSQRVAIMKSLEGRTDHPSAEQLFIELKPEYPTLSIATVYSTTQLMAQASMIRILTIDKNKVNFDPNVQPHGHFMCRKCKRIVDLPMDVSALVKHGKKFDIDSIDAVEVFLYGFCSECGDL